MRKLITKKDHSNTNTSLLDSELCPDTNDLDEKLKSRIWWIILTIYATIFGLVLESGVLVAQLITFIWNHCQGKPQLITNSDTIICWSLQLVALSSFYVAGLGLWKYTGGYCIYTCANSDDEKSDE